MARRKNSGRSKKGKSRVDKKKLILYSILIVAIVCIVFVAWTVRDLDFTMGDAVSMSDLNLTSVLYWENPKTGEYEEYEYLSSGGKRIWTDIDTIPNWLEDAFIAIEDQRFLSHHGVDWKRTTGAVLGEIFKGGSSYGGSSITQQLVKNVTGERDRKYTRKIKEIIRALVLETRLSKQQILELYLNTIYLGHGCNGVESAARVYFDKSVSDLTLAESASIAGITQYPALYDPHANKEENIKKQRIVLAKMLELGYIDQSDYDKAIAEELQFKKGDELLSVNHSYFADQIVEDVIADLCEEHEYSEAIATQMIYNSGLKIYTTVDKNVQNVAEGVFENDNNYPSSGGEQLQAAIVITEPDTGYVKAIVGGRGKKQGSRLLNRATQTKRQSGSAIKPLSVYAPAIDLGLINADTIIKDEPINIRGWAPKNHYNSFRGDMTVRTAVNVSANIPAVKVLQMVTVDKSFDYMKNKLHFSTLIEKDVRDGKTYTDKTLASLALGGFTDGVTVADMTSAYATFANEGVYIEPITYTKVEDNQGKTLLTKKQKSNIAFKPSTAFFTNQLLKGVVTSGTAAGSTISGMDTAGKTGTTDGDTDRWFAGYTPYYSAVVWVGYDNATSLPSFSSNPALNLWKKVMVKIHSGLSNKYFSRPSGLISASVCSETGLLYTEQCLDEEGNSTQTVRYYEKGKVPTVYCSGHGPVREENEESEITKNEETEGDINEVPSTEDEPDMPGENIEDTGNHEEQASEQDITE